MIKLKNMKINFKNLKKKMNLTGRSLKNVRLIKKLNKFKVNWNK